MMVWELSELCGKQGTVLCHDASGFVSTLTHQKLRWFLIHNVAQVFFLPIDRSIVLRHCWELTAGHIWLCIYRRLVVLWTCTPLGQQHTVTLNYTESGTTAV